MRRKGTHHWWGCKLVQPLWKTVRRCLKKLKVELPYDPAIPLLGLYPKEMKTLLRRDICTLLFIAALSTVAKTQRPPKCALTDKWIQKMWYLYTRE